MFKPNLVAGACVCVLMIQGAHAQSAADVQRNIDQNRQANNPVAPKSVAKKPIVITDADQGFTRLKEIKVNSPLLQEELLTYWTSEINKSVPAQKLADFKAFAWELFQAKGYLAYITTSAQATPEGSVLTVNVTFPQVGKVSVVAVDTDNGKKYAEEVARRFSAAYKFGTPADVQGFENQLNAIAYDLPVDLDVSLRQINDKTVDVVINLRSINTQPGSVLGGLVQANNYGLDQFGRNQALANVRVAGFTSLSELSLTTQQSRGVGYYRADYEAPIVGSGMRWKVYGSEVHSKTDTIEGKSQEIGVGLTKLLSTNRTTRWLGGAEVAKRETWSWTSGVESQDRVDQQLRLKLRTEASKGWVDTYYNEILLTTGYVNLDRNSSDQTADLTAAKIAGAYQKLEMNGGLSHNIDNARLFTGSVRWRAQAANKNLDTYSQISLGGINGIRALSTLDGVGDQGVQMSFDIVHHSQADVYGGLFYDVGMVKPRHTAIPNNGDNEAYLLQGVGYQIGGAIEKVNWVLSVARSFGKVPSVWGATNTPIGDARVNFAATYAF